MSISLKPLISTLAEAIVEIVVHDFPVRRRCCSHPRVCASCPLLLPLTLARGVCPQTQWPAFMPSIQENLKRVGELARVHNVLFIVRKIAKRFEYHGKHVRGVVWCAVRLCCLTRRALLLLLLLWCAIAAVGSNARHH